MSWPTVGRETLGWRESWRTYEAAVVPSIAGLSVVELLDAPTAARVGAAQHAVAAFDAEMTDEFGLLELGTIDTVLMRSEASSSSQIEHLTASGKQLALAEIGASKSANARLVQANVAALESASHTHALDTDAVVELQRELLGETGLHIGVRNEQVWIGTSGSSPGWGRVRGAALLPGGGESQRSMGVPQATDNDPGPPPSFGPDGV